MPRCCVAVDMAIHDLLARVPLEALFYTGCIVLALEFLHSRRAWLRNVVKL